MKDLTVTIGTPELIVTVAKDFDEADDDQNETVAAALAEALSPFLTRLDLQAILKRTTELTGERP